MTGRLLRLEGAAVAAMGVYLYARADASWWLFGALALAPDLSMLGYLGGPGIGAASYNAVHTYVGPLALVGVAIAADSSLVKEIALIWFVHIGADRLLGYGLKYPGGFKDTHLQRV
jgi:hypothetical protein